LGSPSIVLQLVTVEDGMLPLPAQRHQDTAPDYIGSC